VVDDPKQIANYETLYKETIQIKKGMRGKLTRANSAVFNLLWPYANKASTREAVFNLFEMLQAPYARIARKYLYGGGKFKGYYGGYGTGKKAAANFLLLIVYLIQLAPGAYYLLKKQKESGLEDGPFLNYLCGPTCKPEFGEPATWWGALKGVFTEGLMERLALNKNEILRIYEEETGEALPSVTSSLLTTEKADKDVDNSWKNALTKGTGEEIFSNIVNGAAISRDSSAKTDRFLGALAAGNLDVEELEAIRIDFNKYMESLHVPVAEIGYPQVLKLAKAWQKGHATNESYKRVRVKLNNLIDL